MNIAKLLSNICKEFTLPNVSETDKIVRICAIAVYWDGQITDKEREEANRAIREFCQERGFSDHELQLAKINFEDKLKEYIKDNSLYVAEKKDLKESFKDGNHSKFIEILKKIFASDGLDESEEKALKELEQ